MRALATALAAGLVMAACGGRGTEAPGAAPAASPAPTPRRAVAVLGFANLSKRTDDAWIATALAEVLDLELSAGEKLRVISVERVREALPEPPVGTNGSFDRDRLAALRDTLGADDFVSGTYRGDRSDADTISLDLRLIDGRTGEVRDEQVGSVSRPGLLDFAARAAAGFRQRLGGSAAVPDSGGARASLPANPEAARLYSDGLARLRAFDAIRARDLLIQAVAVEPDNALIHAALADAWSALGYEGKARQSAARASELAGRLSRERRLLIEAREAETNGQWARAAGIYRTLFSVFPDQPDYGLGLARALIPDGKREEALAVLARLRQRPTPAGPDPRIDLVESEAAQAHADYPRALAAARRAAAAGRALGSDLLVARAHFREGIAQRDQGNLDAALIALREARRLFAAAGDQGGTAQALRYIGTIQRRQGDLDGAQRSYDESLAITERIGDWHGTAFARSQTAVLFRHQGRLADAQGIHERLLEGHREVEDRDGLTVALNNLAYVERLRGELASARRHLDESVALSEQIGSRQSQAVALNIRGWVLFDLGELEKAREAFEQTLRMGRELGNSRSEAFSLYGLGEVALAEGRLDDARARHEAALQVREGIAEHGTVVLSRLALALVDLEEGRGAAAEPLAREAARYLREEGERDTEALAVCAVTRSLIEQGRVDEAQNAFRRAEEIGAHSENTATRMDVALADSELRVASGFNVAQAVKRLDAVRDEARRRGLVGYLLKSRLGLGRIELRFGDPKTGHALLEAVRDEAAAAGYGLVRQQSAAALLAAGRD